MPPKTPKPDLEAKRKREQEELEARYKGPGVVVHDDRSWWERTTPKGPDLELTGRAAEINEEWVKPAQQSPDVPAPDVPPDYIGREAEDAIYVGETKEDVQRVMDDVSQLPDDYLFINDDDLTQSGMSTDEAGWTTMEQTDPDKHR